MSMAGFECLEIAQPYNTARKYVQDDRQIHKTRCNPDVSDIHNPKLIKSKPFR
jgi:hypothetical protein